jgi:acetyl esterase/lipase
VGPSNLETLLATVPPYWAAFFENLARRVGDPRTEAGRAILRERSPLHAAGNIAKPLLIGHGANDPRVKQAESDQIIAAMRAKGLPVTYVLYPEEGHGFAIPENRLSFYAVAEAFLAKHLRGAVEPIADALNGTNLLVPEGGAHIPGLEAALATRANTGHSTCAMRRL